VLTKSVTILEAGFQPPVWSPFSRVNYINCVPPNLILLYPALAQDVPAGSRIGVKKQRI
jgi:hypothetical protein